MTYVQGDNSNFPNFEFPELCNNVSCLGTYLNVDNRFPGVEAL